MKVREIKKEDIDVGIKVIYKRFYNNGEIENVREVSGVDSKNAVNFATGGWETEKLLLDNYFLVEEEPKTNDTKVMTYIGKSSRYTTKGKNYNVRQSALKNSYIFNNDEGNEITSPKRFFADPSEYKNKLENHTHKGAKHDQDKLKPTLLINDMPLALNEVMKVLKFGAEKYEEGNWLKVEDGESRYRNAGLRHLMAKEEHDSESGLPHLSHAITSLLMELELRLRGETNEEQTN